MTKQLNKKTYVTLGGLNNLRFLIIFCALVVLVVCVIAGSLENSKGYDEANTDIGIVNFLDSIFSLNIPIIWLLVGCEFSLIVMLLILIIHKSILGRF